MGGRLTLSLALGIVTVWLVAAAGAGLVVQRELNEVFDSILQETAQRLLADVLENEGERLVAAEQQATPVVVPAVPHEEYITYRVYAADGTLLLHSHAAARQGDRPRPSPGFDNIGGGRSYTEPSVDGRYFLTISEPVDHRGHTIRGTLARLLAPLAALVAAALLLIPWAVRRGFAPVARLKAEIARRGGGNLAQIEDPGLPEELQPIRDDVNLLLRRLSLALAAERRFSANAAHELRTPIAGALAQAQWLVASLADGQPGRAQAEAIRGELRRLGQRIGKLLDLARAEAGVALRLEPVDLLLALRLVVSEFAGRPGAGARLRFCDGGLDEVLVAGDLDVLAIALRNLVENAVVHGDPGGPVEIAITPRRRGAGPQWRRGRVASAACGPGAALRPPGRCRQRPWLGHRADHRRPARRDADADLPG